jgi:hypothetical protein
MKIRILTIVIFSALYLTSCQKDAIVAPVATTTPVSTKTPTSPTTPLNQDTVSNDTTRGYLRVQLAQDSVNTDNILIEFSPNAKSTYVSSEDARTFQGFGSVSLSSLSSDNVALAINALPLSTKGTTVGLVVNGKTTGTYKLNLLAIHSVSSSIDIWLKDKYKKDSVNFRSSPAYAFSITSDTTTYGSNRFSIVMRGHN